MNKLVVCGDSFSSVSVTLPGTHYSELLADKLNAELCNYARRGCSNGGIRLQIDEAIRQKADYVIVVPTSWDRMEIPSTGVPYSAREITEDRPNSLQNHLLDTTQYKGYNQELGIGNINYSKEPTPMIFETIFSLAGNYTHEYRTGKLDGGTVNALMHYVNFLYDSNWKQQQDQWIIVDGLVKLHDANIPFAIDKGMLWSEWHLFKDSLPSFILPYIVHEDVGVLSTCAKYSCKPNDDPGYHSDPKAQQVLAEMFYDKFNHSSI